MNRVTRLMSLARLMVVLFLGFFAHTTVAQTAPGSAYRDACQLAAPPLQAMCTTLTHLDEQESDVFGFERDDASARAALSLVAGLIMEDEQKPRGITTAVVEALDRSGLAFLYCAELRKSSVLQKGEADVACVRPACLIADDFNAIAKQCSPLEAERRDDVVRVVRDFLKTKEAEVFKCVPTKPNENDPVCIGAEAAVVVLIIAIVKAMNELRRQRRPLKKQADKIADWLRLVELRLSKVRGPSSATDATKEAHDLYRLFRAEYGVKFHDKKHKDCTKDGDEHVADADGLCVIDGKSPSALRDLLDANRECVGAADRSHLEKVVELHTQALARQRAFINALVTAFPAIGLIATLHGLIVALSRASGIVTGNESDRLSATELVTGVLSSSFATTMLALTAMAICMLVNTREEHREADLLEDTHRRLNAVFWPGR